MVAVLQIAEHPDSERRQAQQRLTILGLVLGYLASMMAIRQHFGDAWMLSLMLLSGGLAIALAIIVWIRRRPARSDFRRVFGMVADYSLIGIGIYLFGEALVPLYVIMLWVTIGNGLLYGMRFAYVAAVFAAATFLTVTLNTGYWIGNPTVSLGLLFGLTAIPIYLSMQLRQRTLIRTTDAAERANEAKSHFLAHMSHEFRTPLNGILGMSDLLFTSPLIPEQRERAQVIQTSARALQSLVENVLDIAIIEAGKFKRYDADFRLSEVLKDIQVMLRPSARAKDLAFEMSVPEQIPDRLHGDCGRLRQVLVNLLANAIKFTEQGKVSLAVALHKIDEVQVWIRFSVRDTGIGIPAEALARIFEAFEQVDSSRTRHYEGTGLGTTIAKAMTELLGGSIGVESREGVGSHFWIELPFGLAKSDDSAAKPAPAAKLVASGNRYAHHRAQARPMRILVVDDQLSNRMVASHYLEKAGHRPQMVDNGAAALDAIQQQDFDAVLLDLRMPGLNGIEVMQRANVMQAGRERTPFIILTGDTTPETLFECERAGAFAVLSKPLVAERLLEKLAEIAVESQERAPGLPAADVDGEELISLAILEELTKLGADFMSLFFAQAVRDMRKCIADLDLACAVAHGGDFRAGCHALKGVAASMAGARLAEVASDAMRLPNTQRPEQWREQVERLRQLLEATIDALRQRGHIIHDEGDLKR